MSCILFFLEILNQLFHGGQSLILSGNCSTNTSQIDQGSNTINLNELEPYINGPFTPDRATPISRMKSEKMDG